MKRKLKKQAALLDWFAAGLIGFVLAWLLERCRLPEPPKPAKVEPPLEADQPSAADVLDQRRAKDEALTKLGDDLRAQLTAKQAELDQLAETHRLKLGELAQLMRERAATMATMEAQDANMAATSARVNDLDATLKDVLNRKAALEHQLIVKQAEIARLTAEWTAQLKRKDTELGALQAELAKVKSVLKPAASTPVTSPGPDWRAQLADKERVLKQAQQAHRDTLSQLATARLSTDATQAALSQREAEIGTLKQQLQSLNAALQTQATDLATRDDALDAKDQASNELRQRVSALEAELARHKAGQGEVEAQLTLRQNDLSAAQIRIGELESVVATLRASMVEPDPATVPSTPEPASTIQAALDLAAAQPAPVASSVEPAILPTPSPMPTNIEAEPTPTVFKQNKAFAFSAAQQAGVEPTTSACPQDLSEIDGVGSVFEQRLYDAGIGTYWEVANLSADDLRAALRLDEPPRKGRVNRVLQVDLGAIRAAARALAESTQSLGWTWTGGQADDFEPINGIGRVFEQRLLNAGICTYEALIQTDVARLAEICAPSKRVRQPDFASWIAQAKSLAAAKTNAPADVKSSRRRK